MVPHNNLKSQKSYTCGHIHMSSGLERERERERERGSLLRKISAHTLTQIQNNVVKYIYIYIYIYISCVNELDI